MGKRQFLCVVSYKTQAPGSVTLVSMTWFVLMGEHWSLAFTGRLHTQRGQRSDSVYALVTSKVKPAKTIGGQAAYDLRAALRELGYKGWTGPVAARLKKRSVPGVRLQSFKARGGAKRGQQKRRSVWFITADGLKRAAPHLKVKA